MASSRSLTVHTETEQFDLAPFIGPQGYILLALLRAYFS